MLAEQKDLGDSAMGDGEKTCPCCQFYGVPCRQVRATEDEATTRRNQRFSVTPRPTDSTREVENLSDETEELCYSSLFPGFM